MAESKKISEEFFQNIWNDQSFFNIDLQTTDGRSVSILKAGIWNSDEGPDFVRAEIIIEGKLTIGDVEIHINSSDWYAHEHHLNPKYNRVVLHVVYLNDDINLRTRLQDGQRIPTLELLNRLNTPIGDLFDESEAARVATGDFCRVTGKSLNIGKLKSVLEDLGRERLMEKADAMKNLRIRMDFEQLLYEGIMEALGYAKNREPFRELARRVPFASLAGKEDEEIQGILFGTAGLLPSQSQRSVDLDETDKSFIKRIESIWQASEQAKPPTRMVAEQWQFSKTRPGNYPTRRIAAISRLIGNCQESLMMIFLPTIQLSAEAGKKRLGAIRRELVEKLTPAPTGYWIDHSNFGKGLPQIGSTLIGADRALDIIVNILLPIAIVWAEESQSVVLHDAVERLYSSCPKLQDNRITRKIQSQVFSETQPFSIVSPAAKTQQGTIYLHNNFCSSRLCDLCPIINGGAI
ncbi:MAG: DUF2851 family protein [Candidatus Poribacteria bacterium]|nr:DUF2851 family protein [Candidatus Poribacteria bacterium]MDE0505746.1 DUF2851 family protein [Candidatus Poribacteria bacterium]